MHLYHQNLHGISFNFEPISKDKSLGLVDTLGRRIVEKKSISIGGEDIETLDNADVYDTYADLYMDQHVKENALLQGNVSAASLRGILVLFVDDANERKSFGCNNKFYNPTIKRVQGYKFIVGLD